MMRPIVIEVRNGCVVGVYSDRPRPFMLIDWDDLDQIEPDRRRIHVSETETYKEMEDNTRAMYKKAVGGR